MKTTIGRATAKPECIVGEYVLDGYGYGNSVAHFCGFLRSEAAIKKFAQGAKERAIQLKPQLALQQKKQQPQEEPEVDEHEEEAEEEEEEEEAEEDEEEEAKKAPKRPSAEAPTTFHLATKPVSSGSNKTTKGKAPVKKAKLDDLLPRSANIGKHTPQTQSEDE